MTIHVITIHDLWLDKASYRLDPDTNIEKLRIALADAMRADSVVEVSIVTATGETQALVRPGNAKIVYIATRTITGRIGKPTL